VVASVNTMKNTIINNFLKKYGYILPNGVFISSSSAWSTARTPSKSDTTPKVMSPHSFNSEPDFAVASINYSLDDLFSRAASAEATLGEAP